MDNSAVAIGNPAAAEWVPVAALTVWDQNPKPHDAANLKEIARSIRRFDFGAPIVAWKSQQRVVAGHGRLLAAQLLLAEDPGRLLATDAPGPGLVPVRWVEFASEQEAAAYALVDNRLTEANPMDEAQVAAILASFDGPVELPGYDEEALSALLAMNEPGPSSKPGSLADRFGVPPFSVLDARQGYWQERKRGWLAFGIKSTIGRGDNLIGHSSASSLGDKDTSIFDPVLCELIYRWFAPPAATVLDPFAGGSVRGVVSTACGLQYIGFDLRQEQIDANRAQWQELEHNWPGAPSPVWHCLDSRMIRSVCRDVQADLILSCPPYADLEVYSDNPQDLSTLEYEAFIQAYREIIAESCALLKQDRFAVFVVGDIRDKQGFYRNFPSDTIRAFQDAGCTLYNEAILITSIGSLPLRVGKAFNASRKLGKTHQNVLVFFKGNPKNIHNIFEEIDFVIDETGLDPGPGALP